MKAIVASLAGILALCLTPMPVAAQVDDTTPEEAVHSCLLVVSADPLTGLTPGQIGQALIDGELTLQLVEDERCLPASTDEGTEEPPTEVRAEKATPYVIFAARAAGAVIEAARLARRHEGADTLAELDAAAKSLAAWAKKQRKWLDRHPPQACYKEAHGQWRAGLVEVRKGAKDVRRAIRRLRPAPMERAVRRLTSGSQKLAGVDLDLISRACAETAGQD